MTKDRLMNIRKYANLISFVNICERIIIEHIATFDDVNPVTKC